MGFLCFCSCDVGEPASAEDLSSKAGTAQGQSESEVQISLGQESFEEQYRECFIGAFAQDLSSLQEAGGSSASILHTIEATSKAFGCSTWQ